MKHIITYTPRHKQILEEALHMALSWHNGDIKPVVDLTYKAYKANHQVIDEESLMYQYIHKKIQALRNLDTEGISFGDFDVLASILLSDTGESSLTESQAESLMILTDKVSRLISGQIRICFESFKNSLPIGKKRDEHDSIMTSLFNICWRLEHNNRYGIGYSEESDILWDIHQTIRYQRYLNLTEAEKEQFRNRVDSNKPLHTSREPLIAIITILD